MNVWPFRCFIKRRGCQTGDANTKRVLEVFRSGPELLLDVLRSCPKRMWLFRPERLTIHEIILHLADTEVQNYVKCRNFIAQPGLSLSMYDPRGCAKRLGYCCQSAIDALGLIIRLRRATTRVLQQIPDAVWAHTAQTSDGETMTLEAWLNSESQYIPRQIEHIRRIHVEWMNTRPYHMVRLLESGFQNG